MEHFHCKVTLQAVRSETGGKTDETEGLIPLLFDSYSHSSPAGTRSDAMSVRAIVCRVEPYQIDFQIEAHPERNRLVVTGQLLDLTHPDIVGSDFQVTLSNFCGADVQTVTNHFGEFRGELENSGESGAFLSQSQRKTVYYSSSRCAKDIDWVQVPISSFATMPRPSTGLFLQGGGFHAGSSIPHKMSNLFTA